MGPDQIKERRRPVTAKSAYISILFALPVLVIVSYLRNFDEGIGAAICTGIVILGAMQHWDLRRDLWFWATLGLALCLQVPLVLFIPWGDRNMTGVSLLPIAVADYLMVWGCIRLAEKIMRAATAQ